MFNAIHSVTVTLPLTNQDSSGFWLGGKFAKIFYEMLQQSLCLATIAEVERFVVEHNPMVW